MKNKVLVIAVHPDDETLGCGGTLLKHKSKGDDINWLIVTGPTQNHPYGFKKEFIEERNQLIQAVNVAYDFNHKYELNFPTQLLHNIDLREIIIKIDEIISKVQPNILYMMFYQDVHSDHRIAFEAVYSCTKSFRKPYIEQIYMMETLSETEFAPAIPVLSFVPNVYVDITDFFEKKIEIIKLYNTELMQAPYPRSLTTIESLARYRGSRAGVSYAEAFMLLYQKL